MIVTHKRTKQRLLLKKSDNLISTLYVLDENDNKIFAKDSVTNKLAKDVNGNNYYQIAICLNKNLTFPK